MLASTGLTQQDLAARLKRPQSFMAKYELGMGRVDVVEFVVMAQAIGEIRVRCSPKIFKISDAAGAKILQARNVRGVTFLSLVEEPTEYQCVINQKIMGGSAAAPKG